MVAEGLKNLIGSRYLEGHDDCLRVGGAASRLSFAFPPVMLLVAGSLVDVGDVHGNAQGSIIIHSVVEQRVVYGRVKASMKGALFRHQRKEDV